MTNHPFESTGMVTDPGKVTRNLKLVSDYAKAQNIPLSAAVKDLEKTYGKGLETFKPITPKPKTTSSKVAQFLLGNPGKEQELVDGKLMSTMRQKGLGRFTSGLSDALTLNITDFDQRGGGFLGLFDTNPISGLGGKPTDFELPTTVQKSLKDDLDYAEGNTGAATEMKDALDAMVDYKRRINPLERKDRIFDTGLEMAAQRAQLPFITNQMKDLSTFKQRQLLDAEKIKQSFPNAIQSRLLTADTGFKTQADAIAGQTDASTRFAQAGTGIKFG